MSSQAPERSTQLRVMQWPDVDRVMPIERDLYGRESWSAELFRSELVQADTRHYLVATQTERIVGYAGLCAYPDEAYVQTISVERDQWGQGIGTQLLTALLDEAADRGKDVVGLEVRADNPRAQDLYTRFGFRSIGVRRGYYQPSGTDAVVMQLYDVTRRPWRMSP